MDMPTNPLSLKDAAGVSYEYSGCSDGAGCDFGGSSDGAGKLGVSCTSERPRQHTFRRMLFGYFAHGDSDGEGSPHRDITSYAYGASAGGAYRGEGAWEDSRSSKMMERLTQ